MLEIVGVRLREEDRIFYADTSGIELEMGDWCVVETGKGKELGEVVIETQVVMENEVSELLSVVRKATTEDLKKKEELEKKEKKAWQLGERKIKDCRLPMKIIEVRYHFEREKVLFLFLAERRVDIRELIKELSYYLKARVEFKQVSIRNEAKVLGGYGLCGQPLCCAIFKKGFSPVSIRMAKTQEMAINPTKITGVCGRLKCCLAYEFEFYREEKTKFPEIGSFVSTEKIEGEVINLNLLKRTITVQNKEGSRLEVKLEEIKK
jgi:cell fate regulator YaaT (PSP1 superfamily)